MTYLTCEIDDKECAYVIPIGDVHFGDRAFKEYGRKKLKGYLDWVMERQNARIFLNGDIFNCAGRDSKTSPFETDTDEYSEAIDFFAPYRQFIIGATDGNHEARFLDMFGMSPTQTFCRELKIPYCKWSAVVRFKIHRRNNDKNGWRGNYYIYFHHTTGGGGTIGGKLNRVTKLRDIVEGIDVYYGSHNHQLAVAPQDVFYPNEHGIQKRRIWYVDCGSYLEWQDSYAEKGMMAPAKLGSPRIRLDADVHDCHISL
jgi:hypothetical protein